MNYELKSIHPKSVFWNAIRIFVIVGFIVAVLSFYALPNPNIRITLWWQKIIATVLFTGVYTLVVSTVLWLIARLYNAWAIEQDGPSLLQYTFFSFAVPGSCICVAGILMELLSPATSPGIGFTLLLTVALIAVMTVATAGVIIACRSIFGTLKGISIELGEQTED